MNKRLILNSNKINDSIIDVVIPYHSKDCDIIKMCLAGCVNNIHNLRSIYVITRDTELTFGNVKIINEDQLFDDGLSKMYIESRLEANYPNRTGWFFQQFIKMGSSYAIPDLAEYYLVVDADVVFLKKTHFLKNGCMFLSRTKEYHKPHFNCCEALLGETINTEHVFVAHHMLISKSIMLEMLDSIEKRFGKRWYDAILDNIDDIGDSMFSEYETYGHYLENHYPDRLLLRRLRNIQRFKMRYLPLIRFNQTDYVTIHNYKKPQNNPKTNPYIYKWFLNLVKYRLRKQRPLAGNNIEW